MLGFARPPTTHVLCEQLSHDCVISLDNESRMVCAWIFLPHFSFSFLDITHESYSRLSCFGVCSNKLLGCRETAFGSVLISLLFKTAHTEEGVEQESKRRRRLSCLDSRWADHRPNCGDELVRTGLECRA